jgi:hypothetical protein
VSSVAAEHLPAELGKRWARVRQALVAMRALDETSGRLVATLSFTDEAELGKIAGEVFDIYCAVVAAAGPSMQDRLT